VALDQLVRGNILTSLGLILTLPSLPLAGHGFILDLPLMLAVHRRFALALTFHVGFRNAHECLPKPTHQAHSSHGYTFSPVPH
jgi:hypothetical protein